MNRFSVITVLGFVSVVLADSSTIVPPTKTNAKIQPSGTSSPSAPAADSPQSKEIPNSPVITNPAYDPSVYSNFIPKDAVQQYVTQYGPPPPTYPSAGPFPQYTEAFIPSFESIIIPATAIESKVDPTNPIDNIFGSLTPVIATLLSVVAKIGATLLSIAGVVIFGGIITSVFCAFTPFCRMSFLETPINQLKNDTVEAMENIGTQVTTDRIRRAAEFVTAAIEKFEHLQKIAQVSKAY